MRCIVGKAVAAADGFCLLTPLKGESGAQEGEDLAIFIGRGRTMERPQTKLLWDWGEILAMRRWGQAPAAVGTGPGGGWGQAPARGKGSG